MLAGACDGGREGIWSWQAGMLPARIGRILLVACLTASWGVASTCVVPSVASAQDEEAVDEGGDAEPEGKSYLTFLVEALGVKYVIIFLLLSFGLVALLVMCFMQFRKVVMMPPALGQQFEQHLENKEFQQAYELAKNDDSYLGKVLSAGMSKLQSGYPAAVEAMQAAESEQAMNLEHKISFVSLVGALSPMFGLLGTVDGMVAAFMKIAQSTTTPKPNELATGISQALVTTLIGLWLAIPAIACYALLKNWLQRFNMEVDDESMRLMSRFQNMGKK
ncbi:MAG: MotA/TolQ/ExbB proton channel family protein [Planctomycetia bacterium]|nr:MotA/TolQ/ExbB proton channel family protein [Planctomycetia bacterium]